MSQIYMLEALDARVEVIEEIEGWENAVRRVGRLLRNGECIDEEYVSKMVSTCKELGPYVVIAPGVAIPHARPEDGAKRVCLSLLVIKKGVEFGSPNDPVYVLIAFSSPDKHSHIKVLQELAMLLSEKGEEFLTKLREAQTEEEILVKIRELLA